MSSVYTLDHVIKESVEEKLKIISTARGKSTGSKVEIHHSSWAATNAWIESRISKQKGATIAGFGDFCWELKMKDGTMQSRPLFIIADSFVKNNRIKKDRIHYAPRLTQCEEINYSLLAIKYSKNLTKDMVFAGMRDIIRKIGEFIYRGYEIAIEFTFGTLYAKERKVRFEYNHARLQEILPERLDTGFYGVDDSLVDHAVEVSSVYTPNTENRDNQSSGLLPKLALGRSLPSDDYDSKVPGLMTETLPDIPASSGRMDYAHESTFGRAMNGDSGEQYQCSEPEVDRSSTRGSEGFSGGSSSQEMELPPDFRAMLDTIANRAKTNKKSEFRENAKNHVIEQAYLRCLDDVEIDADKDRATLDYSQHLHDDWKQTLSDGKLRQYQKIIDTKGKLDAQMEEKKKIQEEKLREKRETKMIFILPDDAGEKSAFFKPTNSPSFVSKEVQKQIQEKAERKKQMELDDLRKQRDHLERLSLEMDLDAATSRAAHLEKQRMLLEAWERDAHIRNLKKLQTTGPHAVQHYIQRNLSDPTEALSLTTTAASTFKPGLGKSFNMSIGYDPRSSRK